MRKIKFKERIDRDYVRKNKHVYFLFGDNLLGQGRGGQASAMRGEPNAIGVPTKKKPTMDDDAFFTDSEYQANIEAIDIALSKVPDDVVVYIPAAGLGTGFAQLDQRAPMTFEYLKRRLLEL